MDNKQSDLQPEVSPFSREEREQKGRDLVAYLNQADVEGISSEKESDLYAEQKQGILGTQDPEVLK